MAINDVTQAQHSVKFKHFSMSRNSTICPKLFLRRRNSKKAFFYLKRKKNFANICFAVCVVFFVAVAKQFEMVLN